MTSWKNSVSWKLNCIAHTFVCFLHLHQLKISIHLTANRCYEAASCSCPSPTTRLFCSRWRTSLEQERPVPMATHNGALADHHDNDEQSQGICYRWQLIAFSLLTVARCQIRNRCSYCRTCPNFYCFAYIYILRQQFCSHNVL